MRDKMSRQQPPAV